MLKTLFNDIGTNGPNDEPLIGTARGAHPLNGVACGNGGLDGRCRRDALPRSSI